MQKKYPDANGALYHPEISCHELNHVHAPPAETTDGQMQRDKQIFTKITVARYNRKKRLILLPLLLWKGKRFLRPRSIIIKSHNYQSRYSSGPAVVVFAAVMRLIDDKS